MGETFTSIKNGTGHKSFLTSRILTEEEFNQCNGNWRVNFIEYLGFLKHNAGYGELIENLVKYIDGEINEAEFRTECHIKDVDAYINSCIDLLKQYKDIIIYGYDYCEQNGLLSADFINLGFSKDYIQDLNRGGIYTIKQLFGNLVFVLRDSTTVNNVLIPCARYASDLANSVLHDEIKAAIYSNIVHTFTVCENESIDFDTYKDIFNPWHAFERQTMIQDKFLVRESNRVLKDFDVQYKIRTVSSNGHSNVIIKKEENKMKKRSCDTAVYIADNRQNYPYGFLYGALSPKEQNKLPDTYKKNTIDLLDNLSKIDKDVALILSVDRDKIPYNQALIDNGIVDKRDINDYRHIAYKAIKANKDALFNGFKNSHLAEEMKNMSTNLDDGLLDRLNISVMTGRLLRSKGICSIDAINQIKDLDDLRNKLSGIDPRQIKIVQEELLQLLANDGYDTSRFGYTANKEEAKPVSNVKEEKEIRIRQAMDYIGRFAKRNVTADESMFTKIVTEFTRIWRGLNYNDEIIPFAYGSFYNYVVGYSDYTITHVHTENSDSYTFKLKGDKPVKKSVNINLEAPTNTKKEEPKTNPVIIDEPVKTVEEPTNQEIDYAERFAKYIVDATNTVSSITENEVAKILASLPVTTVKAKVIVVCPGCGTEIEAHGEEFFCPKCFKKLRAVF